MDATPVFMAEEHPTTIPAVRNAVATARNIRLRHPSAATVICWFAPLMLPGRE
jgi:hypothetical protein